MAKRFAALKRNASAGQAPQPDPALEKFAPDRFANGRADPRYSLDPGIRHYVLVLRSQGIETCQSCQGGPGHAYLEPTIEFNGDKAAGPKAIAAALAYGLPVADLRREWNVCGGEMTGPIWTITFSLRVDIWIDREKVRTAAYCEKKRAGRDAC